MAGVQITQEQLSADRHGWRECSGYLPPLGDTDGTYDPDQLRLICSLQVRYPFQV
jgi:hypothetical protein